MLVRRDKSLRMGAEVEEHSLSSTSTCGQWAQKSLPLLHPLSAHWTVCKALFIPQQVNQTSQTNQTNQTKLSATKKCLTQVL